MSGDTVVFERRSQVYRVVTASGALLGTEFNGDPLAFDDARQATDMVERRQDLDELLHARRTRP